MNERINLNLVESRLKIRQLVVFNTVLEQKSILKAAEQLNVTQPSVTRTIRDLETLFNTAIFERNNRGVTPTIFGEAFGVRVKKILVELRHSVDELNSLHSGDEGHVIVGTLISASAQLLPQTIAALKKHYPRVVVTVREGTNDVLLPALANGEIDIVLGRIPDDTSYFDVDHYPLYTESLCVMVSANHPFTRCQFIKLETLQDQQWIIPGSESPVRMRVKLVFDKAGLPLPERIVESLSMGTNIGLLGTLDAIALLPGSVAKYYVAMGGFKILPDLDFGIFGDVGYSVASNRHLNPSAEKIIDCLTKEASKIMAENKTS